MSGQPNPTKMLEAFAVNAGALYITTPFPVPSQIPLGSPGKASLNDGFTPLNMTSLSAGGVPMSGPDLNGILNLISQSAAAFGAGQIFLAYDAAYQTAIGGYALGAVLQQAADHTSYWISTVAGNVTDPDTGGAGWRSSKTLWVTSSPSAGTLNNLALPGASDYILDFNTAAGNVTITGLVAQRNMQKVTLRNTGVNALALASLTGSASANQLQIVSFGINLPEYGSATIQWVQALNSGAGFWVQI